MIPRSAWRSKRGRSNRGAIAVITALLMVPMIGLIGLAIDAGIWYQMNSAMSLAANSAAMNALKIAASAEQSGDQNYLTEGTKAGQQWFSAAVGTHAAQWASGTPVAVVTLTGSTTISAKVTYNGQIASVFGKMFKVLSYPVGVEVDASISTTPYLEILFLLDNSSSMDIGATNADITKLSTLSACDPSNALYGATTDQTKWTNASVNNYTDYACSSGMGQYNGATPCPVAAGASLTFPTFTPAANQKAQISNGQTCQGLLPRQQSNGMYPLPGPPCAFACHWTNNASADPAGGTDDLFGMARRNGITVRFDLVKNATNTVLQQMQSDNLSFVSAQPGASTDCPDKVIWTA
jgi:Flp pilus assembly protein TadG